MDTLKPRCATSAFDATNTFSFSIAIKYGGD